jgi:hypothetical protein
MMANVLSGRNWLMQYAEQLAGKGILFQRKNANNVMNAPKPTLPAKTAVLAFNPALFFSAKAALSISIRSFLPTAKASARGGNLYLGIQHKVV